MIFKGYVETKGKRPKLSIKNIDEFYTIDEVSDFKEYGGVLEDDVIMVDLDDNDSASILDEIIHELGINCYKLRTSRGMHFYFKNTDVITNSIHKKTAIGMTVDQKLGTKNTVVPLKLNGRKRKLIKSDTIDPLPSWLKVIDRVPDFFNLEKGDGRNQLLFNYILTLQRHSIPKEDIRETIKIINDYILPDSLDPDELNTILRDESFNKPNFYGGSNGKTFLHHEFGRFLIQEEKIIKINGIVHIYKDGYYTKNKIEIEKSLIKYIPSLIKSKRSEVLSYIELNAKDENLSPGNFIVVGNGLLNIKDLTLNEYDENYICTNKININYNQDAYHEDLDKTLNKITCNNRKLRKLIEEMIGYILLRENSFGKSFILTGDGSNGKSTLLDIINAMIGKENISSLGLHELNQRFKTSELLGKLLNTGDDIGNGYIDDNSTFKKLVTGESINVERKGSDPFDFNNYAKLIFASNEIPRINDTTNALMRRLIIIPFDAKFTAKDPDYDPFIKEKLLSEGSLEYLLKLAVDGLKRLLRNNKFTEVEKVQDALESYEKINNPIVAFLDEKKVENELTDTVYLKYTTWCIESRLKPVSKIMFSRELVKRGFNIKVVRIGKNIKKMYVI